MSKDPSNTFYAAVLISLVGITIFLNLRSPQFEDTQEKTRNMQVQTANPNLAKIWGETTNEGDFTIQGEFTIEWLQSQVDLEIQEMAQELATTRKNQLNE